MRAAEDMMSTRTGQVPDLAGSGERTNEVADPITGRTDGVPDPITLEGSGSLDGGRFHRRLSSESGGGNPPQVSRAIVRAKSGDRGALGFLYARYADCVFGFVASIVRDDEEAQDVTQHVFLKLMKKIDRYEERDAPFVAWLLRVARNVAVDHLRQRRDVPCAEVLGPDAHGDEGQLDRAGVVRDALSRIPAPQREVVVLRHVVGMTPGEIATKLRRSEASIHGLHHRGRGAMRGELEALDAAPVTAA